MLFCKKALPDEEVSHPFGSGDFAIIALANRIVDSNGNVMLPVCASARSWVRIDSCELDIHLRKDSYNIGVH